MQALPRHVPAHPPEHGVAPGCQAGEVRHRAARDEADRGALRQAEQVDDPGTGDVLDGGVGGGEPAQPGVLVPRAHQPVRGQRRGVGAADDEPEEPARRHRGQPGLAGLRHQVHDLRSVGARLRKLRAECLDQGFHTGPGRHRPLVQARQPGQAVLVGPLQRGRSFVHQVSLRAPGGWHQTPRRQSAPFTGPPQAPSSARVAAS